MTKVATTNSKTYMVKDSIQLASMDLKCVKRSMVLCAFNFNITGCFFVNVTLLSFNYSGPNVGYCKYGGLSIYDNTKNATEEVLLLCNNWLSPSSNAKRTCINYTFFSGGLTVSLVTVHLVVLRFFFLFVSILGDVVTVDGEGPVVVAPGVGPPPLEALTNFPPWLGQIGVEAGL